MKFNIPKVVMVPLVAGLLLQESAPWLWAEAVMPPAITDSATPTGSLTRPIPIPRPGPRLVTLSDGPIGDSNTGGTFSCWTADGKNGSDFDLSAIGSLRFTFSPASAGDHFLVRLLPASYLELANTSDWVNEKVYTVPSSGVINIPMTDFTSQPLNGPSFQLTPAILQHIGQISVSSGLTAWNIPLNPSASDQAVFTSIDGVPAKSFASGSVTAPNTSATIVPTPGPISGNLAGPQSPADSYVPVTSPLGDIRAEARFNSTSAGNPSALETPQLSAHDVSFAQ